MSIATEKVGTRIYVTGNTFAVKSQLKSAGCHWDGDRKQWWIGAAKADVIASVVGNIVSQPAPAEDISTRRVLGKVEYKDRSYYAIGDSERTGKWRLTVLDGSIDFWALKDACRWVKTYEVREYRGREQYTTLASLRSFIAEKKQEEAEAKDQQKAVAKVAQGEPTRDISRVSDPRIIQAFFGDRAVAYDYEVTQAEFDRDDNQGPGRYCGVTVPASMADKWNAGINAAKAAGHKDMRSREALLIRYRSMHGDAAVLPAELEALIADREQKAAAEQAKKDEDARKISEAKAAQDALLAGLVQSSVGPTAPEVKTVHIDTEAIAHHMATADPGECIFGGEGMAYLSDGSRSYTEGRTADGQRIVREDYHSYDDDRTYYWAPAGVARAWALAYAAKRGITVEQARAWLAEYNGCHGSDLYLAVASDLQAECEAV